MRIILLLFMLLMIGLISCYVTEYDCREPYIKSDKGCCLDEDDDFECDYYKGGKTVTFNDEEYIQLTKKV